MRAVSWPASVVRAPEPREPGWAFKVWLKDGRWYAVGEEGGVLKYKDSSGASAVLDAGLKGWRIESAEFRGVAGTPYLLASLNPLSQSGSAVLAAGPGGEAVAAEAGWGVLLATAGSGGAFVAGPKGVRCLGDCDGYLWLRDILLKDLFKDWKKVRQAFGMWSGSIMKVLRGRGVLQLFCAASEDRAVCAAPAIRHGLACWPASEGGGCEGIYSGTLVAHSLPQPALLTESLPAVAVASVYGSLGDWGVEGTAVELLAYLPEKAYTTLTYGVVSDGRIATSPGLYSLVPALLGVCVSRAGRGACVSSAVRISGLSDSARLDRALRLYEGADLDFISLEEPVPG